MAINKKNLKNEELKEIALLTAEIVKENREREMAKAINSVDFRKLVDTLIAAYARHGYAKGRSKDALRGGIMRFNHLGLLSYMYNDIGTPALTPEDCLIIVSSRGKNGEKSRQAKKNGAKVILVTSETMSSAARPIRIKHGDIKIKICTKESLKALGEYFSQKMGRKINIKEYVPLGTLFEDTAYNLLNCIIAAVKEELGETEANMADRHVNY
jgi:D-arabinose 5-phosphate isomerase GutQ